MSTIPEPPERAASIARRLLDAQVAFHLGQLSGPRLAGTVELLADDLFAAAGRRAIGDLVGAEAVSAIICRALLEVPASSAVSGFVELATDVLRQGPAEPYPLGDVVDREQVEALVDELLAATPALERALERLTASPLVGTTASRFMGRIVGEVLQANKAVADKVPGLGSLMSLGTSAASKMMGAADKQLEGLLGDTVGKGGTYAVRRLNKIVIETLQDPTTREALLQVWDLAAQQPVTGMGGQEDATELAGVVDAAHDIAITALASEHVARLVVVVVETFFERFGGYTPLELLEALDLERAELVADLVLLAPGVVDALRETGELERLLRARLEPFFASAEVVALLE